MKKQYIQPQMEVVIVQHTASLLAGSAGSVSNSTTSADQLSRQFDGPWFDDDDDMDF